MAFNPNQDFRMQSVLDISLRLMNGLDFIKMSRKKRKQKIIAGFLPPMELGFCSDKTIPFFLARFIEFPFQDLIKIFAQLNKSRLLKNILEFIDNNKQFIERIQLNKNAINAQALTTTFSDLNLVAETARFYLDSCVQTRVAYGAYLKYQKYFDLLIGGFEGNYCLHFAKFYERINLKKPVFYLEKPYGNDEVPRNLELVIGGLEDYFKKIEEITNESIDFKYVKDNMKLINDTRKIGAIIQNRYYNRGYVPLHATASAALHGAYVDFLSDIKFFHEKLRSMIVDFEKKIKEGMIRNYKKEGIPRVLITGSPGFDPALPSIVQRHGGCFLYLDIFANKKFYSLIDLSGDFIEKYARFLLKINYRKGTEDLIDYWIDKARQTDVDGIIFNEVWGCRFITPSYKLFKDRVREELDIPIVSINFHNFGENLGQVSTRIGAFMELIR
ncbi:MAG: 2-hydroxyacyl-CoA dehydratase [Candidatus Helarchaeota archaeon]